MIAMGIAFFGYTIALLFVPVFNLGMMMSSPLNWVDFGAAFTHHWLFGFIIFPAISYFLIGLLVGAFFPFSSFDKKTLIIQSIVKYLLSGISLFLIGCINLLFGVWRAGV